MGWLETRRRPCLDDERVSAVLGELQYCGSATLSEQVAATRLQLALVDRAALMSVLIAAMSFPNQEKLPEWKHANSFLALSIHYSITSTLLLMKTFPN
jgi:hypothetical protein